MNNSPICRLARALWDIGQPCNPLPAWLDVQLPKWARRLPEDIAERVKAFGPDMQQAGIAAGLWSADLTVNPARLTAGGIVIKLPLERDVVVDLFMPNGTSLAGRGGPTIALQDRWLRERVDEQGQLVLAGSLEDMALLGAWEIPAVPWQWLPTADRRQWRALGRRIHPGTSPCPDWLAVTGSLAQWKAGSDGQTELLIKSYGQAAADERLDALPFLIIWRGAGSPDALTDLEDAIESDDVKTAVFNWNLAGDSAEDILNPPADPVHADHPAGGQDSLLLPGDFRTAALDGQPRQAILRVTGLGVSRQVPQEIKFPGLAATGSTAAATAEGFIPVPAAVQVAIYDRPNAKATEQAAIAMNASRDSARSAASHDHELVGAAALLLNSAGGVCHEPVPVSCYMPAMICPAGTGEFLAAVTVVMHRDRAERVLWVNEIATRPPRHRQFVPGDERLEDVLRPFAVLSGSLADMVRQSRSLARWCCEQLRCDGRRDAELLALLTLLAHTSVSSAVTPVGKAIPVASCSPLVVGPNGVGKTTIVIGLTEQIGFGEVVAGESISRAGLLYAVSGDKVRPGAFPRNHKGLLAADELHKDRDNCLASATSARSSGTLRVRKAANADLPMNVRFIGVGNLRLAGARGPAGGRSLTLDDLEYGVLGAGFLEPEDLRRFDAILVVGPPVPPPSTTVRRPNPPFCWDGLRSLIATSWDLNTNDPDAFDWGPGTADAVQQLAEHLNDLYGCQAVPIFGVGTADKMYKLACAAARLLPVTLDRKVHITVAHVKWVAWLLHMVYQSKLNGLAKLAKAERSRRLLPEDKTLGRLVGVVRRIKDGEALARALVAREYAPVHFLATVSSYQPATLYRRLREFQMLDLARSHGRNGFAATPLLAAVVRTMDAVAIANAAPALLVTTGSPITGSAAK